MLNSCYSREHAAGITEHVDCAIGMSEEVTDAAAIVFARSFYNAIGNGYSIAAAFEQGKAAIGIEHIAETKVPELFVRPGIDADRVLLAPSLASQAPALSAPHPPAGRPPVVSFALLALTALVAVLVVWRHERIESGSTLIAILAVDADLKNLVANAQRSVSASFVSLDRPIVSHDGRWFSGIGARPGLTLKGDLEKALSLYQFMNLLAPAKVDGGFACEVAQNLDGGNTIQFPHWEPGSVEGSAPKHDYASSRRVANFLAITPR